MIWKQFWSKDKMIVLNFWLCFILKTIPSRIYFCLSILQFHSDFLIRIFGFWLFWFVFFVSLFIAAAKIEKKRRKKKKELT